MINGIMSVLSTYQTDILNVVGPVLVVSGLGLFAWLAPRLVLKLVNRSIGK